MVDVFQRNIEDALNDVAPVKSFTIKSNYKFGISDETKKVMHERDVIRRRISTANSVSEKAILQAKYKALRNKVTRNIRQENIDFNNNRVNEAGSEAELWKIARYLLKQCQFGKRGKST